MIGLDPEECRRPEFAAVFSGNAPLPQGVRPYAQNYGGHQFGMVLHRCAFCTDQTLSDLHAASATCCNASLVCDAELPVSSPP